MNNKHDADGIDADQQQPPSPAPNGKPEARVSDVSIYVHKKTQIDEGGEEKITFDVGVDGRSYIFNTDRAGALEQIGVILDSMD